jgi:uronate dehydrogenase
MLVAIYTFPPVLVCAQQAGGFTPAPDRLGAGMALRYCVLVSIIVITGAAGTVGSMLRPRLARPDRTLRLLDIAAIEQLGPREEAVRASATDMAAMTEVCRGADAVIHLAGIPAEAPWEQILDVNINSSYVAFEAARRAGVPRVIFASSNHAVGFTPRADFPVPDYAFARSDTYYGVSKVATEGIASLYHYRYGLDAICIRILTCTERPRERRALSTWLSPDDTGRAFEACLTAPSPGFRVIWGVSANTRGGFVSLAEANALGFYPQDDAEVYAAEIMAGDDRPDEDVPELRYLGGPFTLPDLDAPLS